MFSSFTEADVFLWQGEPAIYPEVAPFHPDRPLPEFPKAPLSEQKNIVYQGVREVFHLAGLDQQNYGTPEWNPLAGLINHGDVVLLKPNLVKERHPRDPVGWRYILTHGSVIRAVADYVFKALAGTGRVIVGDAPQTDSSFAEIVRVLQLDQLVAYYRQRGESLALIDFRQEEWTVERDVIIQRRRLAGDPDGYLSFDLAGQSAFAGHRGCGRYYGADYDWRVVNQHHDGIRHEYLVAATAIKCDVLFNLPKMKTHKKAGVTVNLKNLVGINGDKNWLPHHTAGSPADGGDQYPFDTSANRWESRLTNLIKRATWGNSSWAPKAMQMVRPLGSRLFGHSSEKIRSGNWSGNDTVWRMCLDLNRLVMYGRRDGTLNEVGEAQPKRFLCLVDGIIGGQGDGPMDPDPYPAGTFVFGRNPAVVDAVTATLMGYDFRSIPVIRQSFADHRYPLSATSPEQIQCFSNRSSWAGRLVDIAVEDTLHFRPHFGWADHLTKRSVNYS